MATWQNTVPGGQSVQEVTSVEPLLAQIGTPSLIGGRQVHPAGQSSPPSMQEQTPPWQAP